MLNMSFFSKKPRRIFLDYASITPISPEVIREMHKYENIFANPSALYDEALEAKELVKESREKIGNILNARKEEIIFTSSGTEGNNLALLGVFEAHQSENFKPHFIVTNIEHPSILEVCSEIERRGGEVTYIPVSEEGMVDPKIVSEVIKENTVLVSIMYANNEIGTIQPIKEIGKLIREFRKKNNTVMPYFHTDACQVALYLDLDVLRLSVDLMTLDGIKMYGPRGIGVLYVRNGTKILPILHGGGQEKGIRSGTENVSGIIGLAKAFEVAAEMKKSETIRLTLLRDYATLEILKQFPSATLNGSKKERLPSNINICFPGLDAEFSVISLDVAGFSASYSSSCRTLKEDSSSYVIENIGKKNCNFSSLRFSLGRESKKEDISDLIIALKKIVII